MMRRDRGQLRWLGYAAVALGLVALPLAAGGLAGLFAAPSGPPPPVHSGPFTVRAWYAPDKYMRLSAVPLADGPGLALLATTDLKLNRPVSALLAAPDGGAGLRIVRDLPRDPRGDMALATGAGRALVRLRSGTLAPAWPAAACGLQWTTLGQSVADRTQDARYSLSLPDNRPSPAESAAVFAGQDGQPLAALPTHPDPAGRLPLMLAAPGAGSAEAQTLELGPNCTAAAGPAWADGAPTLAVLCAPDKLYLLDRPTQRLVERPELAALAASGLSGVRRLRSFALASGCLAVYDDAAKTIRLADTVGNVMPLQVVDPYLQHSSGTRRLLPGGPALLGNDASVDKALDYAAQTRREGRTAPADRAAQGGLTLLPVDAKCIAIVDRDYCRVLLVQHE
jgi:hypothetical protein